MTWLERGILLVLVALSITCLPVEAREERTGAYFGLSWGQSKFDTSTNTIDPSNCGGGIPCGIDESSTMWKLFGGFRCVDWIAFEADLRTFGDAEGTMTDRTFTIEGRALDFYLRGIAPVGPVDLFIKLGLSFVDGEYSQVCADNCQSGKVDFAQSGFSGGLGIMGNIGGVGLRLEWEPYNISSFSRVDVFSIGVQYRFGPLALP